MKKTIIALLAVGTAASVLAQGTITFNNRVSGTIFTRVYAPQVGNPAVAQYGNTATDTPAGSAVYTGAGLAGSAWTAQLWGAAGADVAESSLVAASPTTTFRTTASTVGQVSAVTVTLTGVAKDAPAATIQMRVFPSTYATWAAAETAWKADTTQSIWIGKSMPFNVALIGGDVNTPPNLVGLTSFSLIANVPEPSTFALLGLGALGMLIFRRK